MKKVRDYFHIDTKKKPFWLGFVLQNSEEPTNKDSWVSLITGEKMSEDLWHSGEPNNKDNLKEFCALIYLHPAVNDVNCENYGSAMVICETNAF